MPRNTNDSADHGAKPREGQVQGEGDYVAGRRYQEAERSFAKTGPVDAKAHEAADALSGPEGAELERARRETGKGRPAAGKDRKNAGGEDHPHTEDNLDHGLKETFPASDPVSISPGAD